MCATLPASYRPVAVPLFLLLALSANDLTPLAATQTPGLPPRVIFSRASRRLLVWRRPW